MNSEYKLVALGFIAAAEVAAISYLHSPSFDSYEAGINQEQITTETRPQQKDSLVDAIKLFVWGEE